MLGQTVLHSLSQPAFIRRWMSGAGTCFSTDLFILIFFSAFSTFTLYGARNPLAHAREALAWRTRLLADHPGSSCGGLVEKATRELASRLPGSRSEERRVGKE